MQERQGKDGLGEAECQGQLKQWQNQRKELPRAKPLFPGKPNLEGSWQSYLSGWDREFWDEKHLNAPGAGGPSSHNYIA